MGDRFCIALLVWLATIFLNINLIENRRVPLFSFVGSADEPGVPYVHARMQPEELRRIIDINPDDRQRPWGSRRYVVSSGALRFEYSL